MGKSFRLLKTELQRMIDKEGNLAVFPCSVNQLEGIL